MSEKIYQASLTVVYDIEVTEWEYQAIQAQIEDGDKAKEVWLAHIDEHVFRVDDFTEYGSYQRKTTEER